MRAIVCGGRDYDERARVFDTLDEAVAEEGLTEICHGACPYGGADILAEEWAKSREIPYRGLPARFKKLGKSAGPKRNQQMLDKFKPDVVFAFPGGRGTADMIARARAAGVRVVDIDA